MLRACVAESGSGTMISNKFKQILGKKKKDNFKSLSVRKFRDFSKYLSRVLSLLFFLLHYFKQ